VKNVAKKKDDIDIRHTRLERHISMVAITGRHGTFRHLLNSVAAASQLNLSLAGLLLFASFISSFLHLC
jgi:hypothetical protein